MKTTKRIFAFALILMLILSLSAPAFADDAQYTATKEYLEASKEVDGLECEYDGIIDFQGQNHEKLNVTYSGDLSDYTSFFYLLFSEDGEEILFYMPSIITCSDDDYADVLVDVNSLNARSTSVKLYLDEEDNSVIGELYLLSTPETASELALVGTGLLISFTDQIFELLTDYNTAA